jgi:hypothetical protein
VCTDTLGLVRTRSSNETLARDSFAAFQKASAGKLVRRDTKEKGSSCLILGMRKRVLFVFSLSFDKKQAR